jgi:hypothetical protein
MQELDVFLSVSSKTTDEQEAFVRAVEDRLRSEGIRPHTINRNTFSSDAPLKAVTELMDKCVGTVVIALERTYFPSGLEKRGGSKEVTLSEIKLPTPFNQIEAAMAYSRGHPLMVIVEEGVKSEGLLESGYDWYVQWVRPEPGVLMSPEFNGVLADWKQKLIYIATKRRDPQATPPAKQLTDMTIIEIVGELKPAQLWSVLTAVAALIAGAFALGANLFG